MAEYTMRGIDCRPVFRFTRRADGELDYHILVEREPCTECPSGFEDPSRKLGMGSNEVPSMNGPYRFIPIDA